MSSSSHKNDDGVPPLYRQGGYLSKVGYFKAAYFKISSDDLFRDFIEAYRHAISLGVHEKCVKDGSSCEPCSGAWRAIKFHLYYFVLGFTFPMPRFFQEMLCFMKCAPAQCSPNVVCVMVWFFNLSQFFNLDMTGVGQLRSCHMLFDNSSKGDHDWAKETLEITGEWVSDSSPELRVLTEKCGLPPRKEVRRIKVETLAHPITVRYSLQAQEMLAEKKPRTSAATREGSSAAPKLVIDLTSSKGEKDEAARSVPVMSVVPKVTSLIANRITQCRSFDVPSYGSPSEIIVTMKSDKVDFATKMVPKPFPLLSGLIRLLRRKRLLVWAIVRNPPNLLEDMDVCTKFVNDVKEAVSLSSFMKHTTEYRRTALLAMMQKTVILVAKSMFLNQEDTKVAKEIGCYIPLIQDLDRAISEFHFVAYAKDEELIPVVGRLEPQVFELESALKINDSLKKEVDELQRSQADFYKLGYVDHLFRRSSDFEFVGKDFETFSISPEDFLAFTFETSIAAVGETLDGATAEDAKTAEGQAVDSLLEIVGYHSALGSSFGIPRQSSIERTRLLKAIENRFVGCFSLSIALRIFLRGHVLLGAILLEELRQIFAHELPPVVGDNALWDAKSKNDVPPYKALYVRLSHVGDIGPTKSIAHCMNGQGLVCGCNSLAGNAGIDL
ncbi:hypothetical protein D8674_035202 [Pyrus ussuriensis x Pyrus communis]|uniref:Uncharacterized protein n=1 Tax=Pyrus ussuriensis x Pyrus communis TaxID=2448454 RepID=A0A5N5GBS5_9ROSA|nr:hypothetical protein D8674_035202 [Pyrus ussuriensis x Pyrus communis]